MSRDETWPALPLDAWEATRDTLHMWTQIAGKIRMAQTPFVNHWWHVTLYVTPRGLTTSAMPHGGESFAIDFDFIDHRFVVTTSWDATRAIPLAPRSVADFYREVMRTLDDLGIHPKLSSLPSELEKPIRFEDDTTHAAYDAEAAHRFWRALLQADRLMKEFRGRFRGKCSPVHFFWGGFDHAVTRFSGRPAPPHPDWPPMEREAYADECCSAGWWPGGGPSREAMFFSYAAPEPPGFADAAPRYDRAASLCLLPYEEVRRAADPDKLVLDFYQGVYEVAANLGRWGTG